jgi:hypothetical protein
VRLVEHFAERHRERHLAVEDFRRLGEVLARAERRPVEIAGEAEPVQLSLIAGGD